MSGTEIGLDNTCKSVYALQEFFGLFGAEPKSTAAGVLKEYKEALTFDLKYLNASEEKISKQQRLLQINTYLDTLNQVQDDAQVTGPLKQAFPLYPEPLIHLMQRDTTNLHSIILRPIYKDNFLRLTVVTPTFSAHHTQPSILADTLRQQYQHISFTPKSKDELIARVILRCAGLPVELAAIKAQLIQEINDYLGIAVNLEHTQGSRYAPSVSMNQAYLDEQINPTTTEECVNGLIQYCTPNLFDTIEGSPFYTVNTSERLSILTQFFLAELNIVCKEQGMTVANFGQILEQDAQLTQELATAVKHALEHSAPVEETLIKSINQHQARFELNQPIPDQGIPALKTRFKSHWEHIKASPHFDEFMLLGEQHGLFVAHQGSIATHFANFVHIGWQHDLNQFIQDFESIDKPNNMIPHKNTHILQEMELDVSSMDTNSLQALYDDINTHPRKEALLIQFKQERPDFKAQIEVREFLQHVAYGEQNEAEALLQDPTIAQELLTAHHIPFTDYSGRTFQCTAYEYAYWAKDSHMQRMLEKYIRQDDSTRLNILGRVNAIEEPINPTLSAGFLAPPRIKGVCYTTQDSAGNTIHHRDAHYDLTPLISALQHYVAEFKKKPNKTQADWDAIEKIWIEEVGRAQRDVPAHIAHEYCHPDRSFNDIKKNSESLSAANSSNLKRQLKFSNYETGNYDAWFSRGPYSMDSGLGFSWGIVRGWPRIGRAIRRVGVAGLGVNAGAHIDLAALIIIDNVRTEDLKQSLRNLSQPLNGPAESHGP
jgi:hypothetical protein